MLQLIWLIPLVPLVGVVLNGFWGRKMPRAAVPLLACVVVFAALLLSGLEKRVATVSLQPVMVMRAQLVRGVTAVALQTEMVTRAQL